MVALTRSVSRRSLYKPQTKIVIIPPVGEFSFNQFLIEIIHDLNMIKFIDPRYLYRFQGLVEKPNLKKTRLKIRVLNQPKKLCQVYRRLGKKAVTGWAQLRSLTQPGCFSQNHQIFLKNGRPTFVFLKDNNGEVWVARIGWFDPWPDSQYQCVWGVCFSPLDEDHIWDAGCQFISLDS